MLSVKDQVVNTFGFATTRPCHCNIKVATNNNKQISRIVFQYNFTCKKTVMDHIRPTGCSLLNPGIRQVINIIWRTF